MRRPATTSVAAYADPDAPGRTRPHRPRRPDPGLGKGYTVAVGGMLLLSLVVGIGIFFLLPLFLAQATVGRVDQGFGFQLSEGVIRVVIFIGYLLLVGRAADVRRTFQYHGAEHMSIHTLEAGDPLTVEAARKYPTAHPRCGTEFLVVVLIVSILAFAVVGKLSPLWLVVSRIVLVPVIAAISYEILQLGARHRRHAAGALAVVAGHLGPGDHHPPADRRHDRGRDRLARSGRCVADGNEIPAGSADVRRPAADAEGPDGVRLPERIRRRQAAEAAESRDS